MSARPLLGWAMVFAAACGGTTEPHTAPRAVTIVTERTASDTIGAPLAEPLTVEVRDPTTGAVRAGVHVRFVAVHDDPDRDELLLADGAQLDTSTVATNASGRASLAIRFGLRAGVHRVTVHVDSLVDMDTATYTVTAGAPSFVTIAPQDTALTIGGRFTLAASLLDRGSNTTRGAISYSSSAPSACAVDASGVVRTLAAANCVLTATFGAISATASASVLPNASLLVMRGTTVGTVSLDGGGFLAIADIDPAAGIGRLRWSASGKEVAFTQRLDGVTRVGLLGFDGRMRFLPPLPIDVIRARVSGDESWVAGITPATAPSSLTASIWRLASDGTMSLALCDDLCDFFTSFVEISNDGQKVIYGDLSRVELVDFTTGHGASLGTATLRPRFAPDGTQFAYVTATFGELHVRNVDLSSDRRVAGGLNAVSFGSIVNWSPDSKWIIASTGGVYFAVSTSTGLALPLPSIIGGAYVVLDGWRP